MANNICIYPEKTFRIHRVQNEVLSIMLLFLQKCPLQIETNWHIIENHKFTISREILLLSKCWKVRPIKLYDLY